MYVVVIGDLLSFSTGYIWSTFSIRTISRRNSDSESSVCVPGASEYT